MSIEKKTKMLIVDDNEINRMILAEVFSDSYDIVEAENGQVAVDIISVEADNLSAILLDLSMPIMTGVEVLEWLNKTGIISTVPVFVVTADDSEDSVRQCYELGADDIIQKPVVPYFIHRRVNSITELYESRKSLSKTVKIQSNELVEKTTEINTLNLSIISTLASAIESRDEESGEHVQRLSTFTRFFIEKLNETGNYNYSEDEINTIAEATVLHDIGKIAIPDAILKKPGRLTPEEFDLMKTHSVRGLEILSSIRGHHAYPVYNYAKEICHHHHERWDGRGYPDQLKGEDIPMYTQVVSIADVYDALTNDRVYKKAIPHEEAVQMIIEGQCGTFNPELMDILKENSEELKQVIQAMKSHH